MCTVTSTTPTNIVWYRQPHVQLTNQPNLTITQVTSNKVTLHMWHVTPGDQNLGQYKCVATNSVTTSQTIYNLTGISRAPVITSQLETILASDREFLLTWTTVTLYPIVEYVLMYRRGWGRVTGTSDSWERRIIPEISLPRHYTVYGSYAVELDNANYSYHVKLAAVNSAGHIGLWSQQHTFSVVFDEKLFKGDKSTFSKTMSIWRYSLLHLI